MNKKFKIKIGKSFSYYALSHGLYENPNKIFKRGYAIYNKLLGDEKVELEHGYIPNNQIQIEKI